MEIAFNIERVQMRLLEMAVQVASILEKNDISYQIACGTLLGAVRHGGFIPWDDDFDFALLDDTYDRAIEVLRNELPEDMFVEDERSEPKYFHGWAHVKDLRSAVHCDLFPQDNLYSHHGLSIDLYRWKRIHSSRLLDWRIDELKKYLNRKLEKSVIDEKTFVFQLDKLRENIEREERDTPMPDCDIVAVHGKYRYMVAADVFPLKKIQFEGSLFYCPNNPENILKHFYGDYLKLPEEKERVPHCSKVIWI